MDSSKLVRITSLEQLEPLVGMACRTWLDSPIFALFCPNRHESPETFRQTWRRILKEEFSIPGTIILAACKGQSSDLQDAMGFSIWRRHGTSETAQSWQGDSLNKKFLRIILLFGLIYQIVIGRFPLNRFIDLTMANRAAERQYPAERWRLCWLSIAPQFQRCGVGRRLLQWGIDRSEEEGAPLVLESSKAGRGLYEKVGFKQIGWQKFDGGNYQQPVMLREGREDKKLA